MADGRKRKEWFETFFGPAYGRALAGVYDEARTGAHVRAIRKLLLLRRGQRILDVPCGQGRLTLPLAAWGAEMTGVDLVDAYVRRARRDARRRGLAVRFLCRDMRDITFSEEFHAAVNYFSSVGYFRDEENVAFCRRLWAALRPGGRLLVETINKSWLLSHFLERTESVQGSVPISHRSRYDERTGRVESDWTFHLPRGRERRHISLRVYNGGEMRAMLREAGFRDIRLHGWPSLKRLTRHSSRLIAVARKAPARARRRGGTEARRY